MTSITMSSPVVVAETVHESAAETGIASERMAMKRSHVAVGRFRMNRGAIPPGEAGVRWIET